MKTITASWMISCALLCGCSAASGSDGEGSGINGPANDTYEDGNHEDTKPSPTLEVHPPSWQSNPIDYGKVIQGVPLFPDPEKDAGPAGEEGSGGTEPTIEPTAPAANLPTVIDGNPNCSDVFGDNTHELDVTTLRDGSYASTDGWFRVALDFNGDTVSYTTAGFLIGVLVKGGPHANFYLTSSQSGEVTTVAGEAISHVTFCYFAAN